MPSKKRIIESVARLVPREIAEQMVSGRKTLETTWQVQDVTLLQCELVGMSAIYQYPTEPAHSLDLHTTLLSDVSREIVDRKGTILRYIGGHQIEAVFGAPSQSDSQAPDACSTAISLLHVVSQFKQNLTNATSETEELRVRIGIHTGLMSVGLFGTPYRIQYEVIGGEAGVASAVAACNKVYGTSLLLSEPVHFRTAGQFRIRRLDKVRSLLMSEPFRLYELNGEATEEHLTEEETKLADLWGECLEAFEQRRWKEAGELFQQYLEMRPNDGPATTYRERSEKFAARPPRQDWDGVYTI